MEYGKKLTPLEKIKIVLKVIDEQRKLYGTDNLIISIPEHKFYEIGLCDFVDLEIIMGRLQRKGVLLGLELFRDRDDERLPIQKLGDSPVSYNVRLNSEEFDRYYDDIKQQLLRQNESTDGSSFVWNENCKWINEKTFQCWCGKTLAFFKPDSFNTRCFRILTNKKGNWAVIKNVAKQIGKSERENEVRGIMCALRERIVTNEIKDCFEIIPRKSYKNGGAYRLKLCHLPKN